MNRLRVILADDERPAREFLKSMLRDFDFVDLVGEADNGSDAVEIIKKNKPDLALLDLQMPEMSGIEVVRSLRRPQMPLVAFVTAFDEYAVQAFEVNAVDYLLKPVERSRLQKTLFRAAERLEESDWRDTESEKLKRTVENYDRSSDNEFIERIPVRLREEIVLVPIEDVSSIVADGELLQITTQRNRKYTINHRLKDLESRLDEKKFVRLSRGAIVSIEAVKTISPMPGGIYAITLKNGQELLSSRLQSKMLRTRLFKL